MATDRLTLKQENFAMAYIETANASEAYRRAYDVSNMSPAAIEVEACRLLANPKVALRITILQAQHRKRHDVTIDRLVQELANIAYANPKDYFEWGPDGVKVRDCKELTEQQSSVIAEVSQTVTPGGGTIKVKLADKLSAIDKLGKHLGMFIDRHEHGEPGDFDHLNADELRDYIRERAKASGISVPQAGTSRGTGATRGKPH